ncbi:MAG: FecR family protein [Thermodesulfobacteriota bacterium]
MAGIRLFRDKQAIILAVSFLCFLAQGYGSSLTAQSGLPDNIVTRENFDPGNGSPIGEVQLVQGEVAVFHADEPETGYQVTSGIPLFKGDILVTGKKGKVSLKLNDGSILTLATETRLVLNESIYDPEESENRSSFIGLGVGKIRCWVQKLTGFRRSEFQVKTKTAIVGVRGSDFIVEATDDYTRVTTLDDTRLEVVSRYGLCEDFQDLDEEKLQDCIVMSTTLEDFEQTLIEDNALPTEIESILPEEIEMLKEDFIIRPNDDTLTRKEPGEPEMEGGIRISEDLLVMPEISEPRIAGEPLAPEILRRGDRETVFDETDETMLDYQEERLEDKLNELPRFPEAPNRDN